MLLSVDDGYKAGALGASHFETHGYRAVYFVNPGSLGSKAFLSWDDLKALEARGHVVASHTTDHPNLAKVLAGQDPQDYAAWVWGQLHACRRLLETRLGHPVTALAWPFGAYNPPLLRAAQRAGYGQIYTVSGGLNLAPGLDGLRLRRILLMGHPPLAAFIRHLGTLPVEGEPHGLAEGDMVYQDALPLGLSGGAEGPARPSSAAMPWPGPGACPRMSARGFHYLVLESGDGRLGSAARRCSSRWRRRPGNLILMPWTPSPPTETDHDLGPPADHLQTEADAGAGRGLPRKGRGVGA